MINLPDLLSESNSTGMARFALAAIVCLGAGATLASIAEFVGCDKKNVGRLLRSLRESGEIDEARRVLIDQPQDDDREPHQEALSQPHQEAPSRARVESATYGSLRTLRVTERRSGFNSLRELKPAQRSAGREAGASPAWRVLFKAGEELAKTSGIEWRRMQAMLHLWAKQRSVHELLPVCVAALQHEPADPIGWIQAGLKKRAPQTGDPFMAKLAEQAKRNIALAFGEEVPS